MTDATHEALVNATKHAGVGTAEIRARIVDGLDFLGVELDQERNGVHGDVITRKGSRVTVRVIRTDEESEIARSALEVLRT